MKTLTDSEFIDQALFFWFNDQQHIRSPFPTYIQNKLKQESIKKFDEWLKNIHPDAKDEFNDEMFAEKFEELLFEEALSLVLTEDEKITILYPFLPRLDDNITNENQQSNIIERNIKIEGDHKFLEVKCLNITTNEKWTTSFELPN